MLPNHIEVGLQINQFAFNLGACLTPELTRPFLWGDAVVDQHNRTLTVLDRQKSLAVPFMITGFMQAISKLNPKFHSS